MKFQIGGPRYQHDCTSCLFLGRVGRRDAYFCPAGPLGGSVLLRDGVRAFDYSSMPTSVALTSGLQLGELARHVLQLGFVELKVRRRKVEQHRRLDA